MATIILLLCLVFCLTIVETTELSECLLLNGSETDSNLIERNVASPSAYADINFQWQERGVYRQPKAYLRIYSATDVQAAIKCGRILGLEIVARGGGHGYVKSAYGHSNDDNTLILDLKTFKSITIDTHARTATVDAGALMGHVAYEIWEKGNFVFPYGRCASVGISGYVLGGGHSIFSSLYGMALDSLIELEMVNADAELLKINNRTNTNLFWALRGAGSTGSFGIITKLVLQLYPAPHQIVNIDVNFNAEQFHDVYSVFEAIASESYYYRFKLKDGIIKVNFKDVQNITEAETIGTRRLQQALDLFPAPISPPVSTVLTFPEYLTKNIGDVRSFGYIQPSVVISEPKDILNITSYGTGSEWFKCKSLFINKLLSSSDILELEQLLGTIDLPDVHIHLDSFAQKITDFHPQIHSSFIHRDAYFILFIYMVREKADDLDVSAKLNDFFEKSKRILNHTTSFQNYADDEISDSLERYYGANLPRLIDIKTEIDPDNFFNSNPQSIPIKSSSVRMSSCTATIFISLFCILIERNVLTLKLAHRNFFFV